MPTGTVSRDGAGSRTYPPDDSGRSSGTTAASPPPENRVSSTPDETALQRENDALRRANAQLKAELAAADEDRQEIIDRYEQLLAESRRRTHPQRGRHSASGSSNRRPSNRADGPIATVRAAVGRAVASVASSLGFR
ncbi:hypothetical protein C440_09657 [Haloferax mucosum ATCC BAA-1512]|uniref:Uncharacterized protein n=2 Tax=Haloferax mucosum TaxID=403181 RepID=M0IIQ8_9EURY|nr:hypothetical protein C440_09657 [Haloferax mucosum ATCC BAA-1512]